VCVRHTERQREREREKVREGERDRETFIATKGGGPTSQGGNISDLNITQRSQK